MNNRWVACGGLICGLGVVVGAFARHVLEEVLNLETKYLEFTDIGVRYQMYHGLGILAIGILQERQKRYRIALWLLLMGTVMFSGSLYVIALTQVSWLGATVTPLGGTVFIVGWGVFVVQALRGGPSG